MASFFIGLLPHAVGPRQPAPSAAPRRPALDACGGRRAVDNRSKCIGRNFSFGNEFLAGAQSCVLARTRRRREFTASRALGPVAEDRGPEHFADSTEFNTGGYVDSNSDDPISYQPLHPTPSPSPPSSSAAAAASSSQPGLSLASLSGDVRLLFASRALRMFSFGLLSVVLVLYLKEVGLSPQAIGALFTLTFIGDSFLSLGITGVADRVGRRKMLMLGGSLVVLSGLVFAYARDKMLVLTLAAVFGVISPGGQDIGPFQPIEHSAISQLVRNRDRTKLLAWYSLIGSLCAAAGSLIGGATAKHLIFTSAWAAEKAYRTCIIAYGILGGGLAVLASRMSPKVELKAEHAALQKQQREEREAERQASTSDHAPGIAGFIQRAKAFLKSQWALPKSGNVVLKLCSLYAIDAFGAGFILQSVVSDWFHVRWGADPGVLGRILCGANLMGGLSALAAAPLANRIGLVRCMVFTHLPSNVFLLLVPLMPSMKLAIAMLLMRYSISQMDAPTRSSYTVAVCHPSERTAAAGLANISRTLGASMSPFVAGMLFGRTTKLMDIPWFLAGSLMILYDLLLLYNFRSIRPPEEQRQLDADAAAAAAQAAARSDAPPS
eukprot:tig00020961_g16639.t1